MHPLKTNMRLASAADARARGGPITPDEALQLRYADMLIDVSRCGARQCGSKTTEL